jgi:ATP-binding cassette subfamily C protein
MADTRDKDAHAAVAAALKDCRQAFWAVALFSGIVNILMLAGPLYMLQVYDRVLASRSLPTLVALTVFLVGAYLFQAVLDVIRTRIVVRSATLLDRHLGDAVHDAVIRLSLRTRIPGEAARPVRDLDQIRSFLTGNGPIAIVDLPWTPVFLIICFVIQPWLGLVALIGGIILFGVALMTERNSKAPVRAVARDGATRAAMIEAARRNGETVTAMGMAPALSARWKDANRRYLTAVQSAADVVSSHSSGSKIFRLLLQSAILGAGAWLVIDGKLMPGAMIAASVMMGRALAPIETAIGNWRSFVNARDAVQHLSQVLKETGRTGDPTVLPRPSRGLEVDSVAVAAPGTNRALVADVRFALKAGDALGVIGPSGAGKTSLLRALAGIWQPGRGTIRLDGAALDQWHPDALGGHVGYVAQAVDLFEGTVAENIARMAQSPDSGEVIAAARAAGAHDMILKLPNGYDTPIGESGAMLSAGQRQRVALARALYGDPFLVVLDEPGSNLDAEGDAALEAALAAAKARGAIVVVVAHRPSALAICDYVLVIANGVQQAFGPRDEVLRKVTVRPQPAQAPLRVVSDTTAGGT